eukprot:TRINITY_DN8952_c0_g1_i1.p1 TRINITY_DN8952_c0_g1~~TRINITY_DN8952_c0_g1_i1.p1  ORF type:complete len:284 (-),score=85.85 TRINITY_DN8952_c0_g1_i1:70-921(-)
MGASDYPGTTTTENPVYQPVPTHEQVEDEEVEGDDEVRTVPQPTPSPPHDLSVDVIERLIRKSTSIIYLLICLQMVLCFLQTMSNLIFWVNEAFAIIGMVGLSRRSAPLVALHFLYSFILYFLTTVVVFMRVASFDFYFIVFSLVFIFMMFALQHEAFLFRLYRASKQAAVLPVVNPSSEVQQQQQQQQVVMVEPVQSTPVVPSSHVSDVPHQQPYYYMPPPPPYPMMMPYSQQQQMTVPYPLPQYTPMPYPLPYPYSALPPAAAAAPPASPLPVPASSKQME